MLGPVCAGCGDRALPHSRFKARLGLIGLMWWVGGLAGQAWADAPAPAPAPQVGMAYMATGRLVLRFDDRRVILAARPSDIDGTLSHWRPVAALSDAEVAQGYRFQDIVCDRRSPNVCLAATAINGGDRLGWRALDVATGSWVAGWSMRRPANVVVQDVDWGAGEVLLSAYRQVGAGPDDLAPGLYLWKAGSDLRQARRLSEREDGAIDVAWFLPPARDASSGRRIFLFAGGEHPQWRVLDHAGGQLAQRPWPGVPRERVGEWVYFEAAEARAGDPARRGALSLHANQLIDDQGAWRRDYSTYVGADDADHPPLLRTPTDRSPFGAGGAVAVAPLSLLVAVSTDAGPALRLLCSEANGSRLIRRPELDALASDAVELSIGGGGEQSPMIIVSRFTVIGDTTQALITPLPTEGTCGKLTLSVLPLPGASLRTPALQDVVREIRSVQAKDGAQVRYVMIHKAGARGRVLIRPYGAFGMVVHEMLVSPFERDWVAQGGVLVVPRLRGDLGDGASDWVAQGRGDHKARTVADLIAVSEDLLRRNEVRPGDLNLVGSSAGAFTAAKAALTRPDLYRRVVLISGALDLRVLAQTRETDAGEFGSPDGDFPDWYHGVKAPIGRAPRFLLLQGQDDERLSPEQSQTFGRYIVSLGYHGELDFTTGGHQISSASVLVTPIEAFLATDQEAPSSKAKP
jgi:predicted esterase